ncbi:Oidioi.mRNA.OKI2018_I69.XSR.g15477.t1.cds [Oikopleura dioica]|uniref:Oidioi.mRNA.OKI2018_I69.XSR.g15477.t1.cds n=1 Tax=Oikopleura dioica TaxID=34765 RepID=A0ABN7SCZ9_OIKDI|nr:Oidioi.mRNA.OKI2018_I69.XSR.g15477.t1.cds [Oikopleura dioica]
MKVTVRKRKAKSLPELVQLSIDSFPVTHRFFDIGSEEKPLVSERLRTRNRDFHNFYTISSVAKVKRFPKLVDTYDVNYDSSTLQRLEITAKILHTRSCPVT